MIAVDLGQSGCRISIEGQIHSTNRGKHAGESVLRSLGLNFGQFNAQSELVSLSLTGLFGVVGDVMPYLELCNQFFGAKEVAVIDDGLDMGGLELIDGDLWEMAGGGETYAGYTKKMLSRM